MTDLYHGMGAVVPLLSLHHLNALDTSPGELVSLAAAAGCGHVCLFTHVPDAARKAYPLVAPSNVPELRSRMSDTGVALCNIEVFPLDAAIDWTAFDTGLATGAALGATRATVHIHDIVDTSEAIARFTTFCDRAATHGIAAGLEFNAFSAVRSLSDALHVVRGAAHSNGDVVCDLLHLVRNGGTVTDMAAAADRIGYFQICDGPLDRPETEWWHEAVRERGLPGTGQFPIVAALRSLVPGTVVDIEVPQTAARKAGVSAHDRIDAAVAATRRSLQAAFSEGTA